MINHHSFNSRGIEPLLGQLLDSPWYAAFLLQALRDDENKIIDFIWVWGNTKAGELFSHSAMVPGNKLREHMPGTYTSEKENRFSWYAEVTEKGEAMEKEYYQLVQNGTNTPDKQWYRDRITRVNDGVLVMSENITSTKANQVELQRKNTLLQGVLDSTWSGVGVFKAVRDDKNKINDFLFIMLNKTAKDMYARYLGDFDPAKGKLFSHAFPGGLKPNSNIERYARVVETGEPFQVEFFYEHDDLNEWIRESGTKYEDGLVVSTEIISPQKKRAEELKRSQELLLESQNIANIGAFEWNEQMHENYCTPQLYTIYGIEPGSGQITPETILSLVHADDKENYRNALQALKTRRKSYTVEYRIATKDGKIKHIWERGRYQNSKITGAAMDITERKELELKMHKLATRNAELDTFVYTASHDLRSPVGNMESLLSFLDAELEDKNENIEMYISLLGKSISGLKSTLQDLTQVTEIHAEKTELVNLSEVVNEVKSDLGEQIKEAGAIVEVDLGTPFLNIPRRHARSLIYNMLSNAIKFRSKDRPLVVAISAFLKNNKLQLTFADNGIGIREENMPKVFQIFKRFNPEIEGRGVGMYLVKRVIDLNNGDISMESQENVGTTFHLTFPLA
jgi:two-component system CheB/CheR fusion protein